LESIVITISDLFADTPAEGSRPDLLKFKLYNIFCEVTGSDEPSPITTLGQCCISDFDDIDKNMAEC
jgi:hypothetical protein